MSVTTNVFFFPWEEGGGGNIVSSKIMFYVITLQISEKFVSNTSIEIKHLSPFTYWKRDVTLSCIPA